MGADKYKIHWKIKKSDNDGSFPVGEIQKLKPSEKGDAYELKWKAGQIDCSFFPLFPDPEDPNKLSNPRAIGRHGGFEAVYDVKVVIIPTPDAREALIGSSTERASNENTPAPLVGQWGAETPPPPSTEPSRRPVAVENER